MVRTVLHRPLPKLEMTMLQQAQALDHTNSNKSEVLKSLQPSHVKVRTADFLCLNEHMLQRIIRFPNMDHHKY